MVVIRIKNAYDLLNLFALVRIETRKLVEAQQHGMPVDFIQEVRNYRAEFGEYDQANFEHKFLPTKSWKDDQDIVYIIRRAIQLDMDQPDNLENPER